MTEPLLTVQDLTVRYEEEAVLHQVNLTVGQGDFLGIIGPNGGGKTTLLKAILGLIKPEKGKVTLKKGLKIGYVPQRFEVDKNFPISVAEVVSGGRAPSGLHPFMRLSAQDAVVRDVMAEVGIADLANHLIGELSGGQFQKTLIARALSGNPEVLFLDEPTASIDTQSAASIYEILRRLNEQGMTIIMVSHDLNVVSRYVGALACVNRTLVYHGEPLLSEEVLQQAYGCPVEIIAHGDVPHRVLGHHHKEGEGC